MTPSSISSRSSSSSIWVVPAWVTARTYPLDKATHGRLRRYLEFQRGEETTSNLSDDELQDMKRALI